MLLLQHQVLLGPVGLKINKTAAQSWCFNIIFINISNRNVLVVTPLTSLCCFHDLRGAREGIMARNNRNTSRTPLSLIWAEALTFTWRAGQTSP